MRIALGVEYDGSAFSGWETQVDRPSVQRTVEDALSRVADRSIRTVCAGRTDAGVHAFGQVVHFDTDVERPMRAWIHGTNSNMNSAVSVCWAQAVPVQFHARYSAHARHYRYFLLNRRVRPAVLEGRVGWAYQALNAQAMQVAGQHLLGEHDFSAFRASGCQSRTPVREVLRIEVRRHADMIITDVAANAFLQHMVRNIMGALIDVGAGKHAPDWLAELLAARDRRLGGATASPQGLYLVHVAYPEHFAIPALSPCDGLW